MSISSLVSAALYCGLGVPQTQFGLIVKVTQVAGGVPEIQLFSAPAWSVILPQPTLLCRKGFESVISFASKIKQKNRTYQK